VQTEYSCLQRGQERSGGNTAGPDFLHAIFYIMRIKTAFSNNGDIPDAYTCTGDNKSLPVTLEDVPENTRTYTLIFEDTDATPPWTHWLVFNIPSTTTEMREGAVPEGGTEGLANNNSFGYEGPCPKYFGGTHHYVLSVYALDCRLDLPVASDKEAVKKAMQGHTLEMVSLMGICTSK